jgi:hypothetical protein
MLFVALASDHDGTIAADGKVDQFTLDALAQVKSAVVNLLATEVADRPAYFNRLMGQITGLRSSVGRPHWLILDEVHHISSRGQPRRVSL